MSVQTTVETIIEAKLQKVKRTLIFLNIASVLVGFLLGIVVGGYL